MRRTLILFVASTLLAVAGSTSARAASTRAEYIAQVDPICQSSVGPNDRAVHTYLKNWKLLGSVAKNGTLKQFVGQTKRIAGSLRRLTGIKASLTSQIATVPPPTEDFATVGTWLDYRRQEEAHFRSAASILVQFKPYKQYFRQLKMADAADRAATQTVSGLGFQVCEVII